MITLTVVHKNEKHIKGAYEANYKHEGMKRCRQASLSTHGEQIAFEIVDIWAEDKAKELGLEYVKVSKAVLDKKLSTGTTRSYKGKPTAKLANVLFNNEQAFKNEVEVAIDKFGIEKVEQVLNFGLAYLFDLSKAIKEKAIKEKIGKEAIAKTLYHLFVDNQIDMSETINDKEVLTLYNELKAG